MNLFYLSFRCFCYAETGEQIFGWDWWRNADKMTCACSRQRFKAESSGRLDVTLHCLPNGNFERLQCDMEICWCAEELYGMIFASLLLIAILFFLKEQSKMGLLPYLKVCGLIYLAVSI